MQKTTKRRTDKAQKVRKGNRSRISTNNLQQDLEDKIEMCYEQESYWFHKGREYLRQWEQLDKKS